MNNSPVIIHQMAKVGSTAIQLSIEQQGLSTLQTHHLGLQNLKGMLHEYLEPYIEIDRVYHELELFNNQIIATKWINFALDNKLDKPLKVITLVREPFERWFSALVQNFNFHRKTAQQFYSMETLKDSSSNLECFDFLIDRIYKILNEANVPFGSEEFLNYIANTPVSRTAESGQKLKLLTDELVVPFYWFQTAGNLLKVDFFEGQPIEQYHQYKTDNIEVLLLKFEFMKNTPKETEQIIKGFLNLDNFELCSANVSKDKTGYDVIKQLKDKYYEPLRKLDSVSTSQVIQHFGYL